MGIVRTPPPPLRPVTCSAVPRMHRPSSSEQSMISPYHCTHRSLSDQRTGYDSSSNPACSRWTQLLEHRRHLRSLTKEPHPQTFQQLAISRSCARSLPWLLANHLGCNSIQNSNASSSRLTAHQRSVTAFAPLRITATHLLMSTTSATDMQHCERIKHPTLGKQKWVPISRHPLKNSHSYQELFSSCGFGDALQHRPVRDLQRQPSKLVQERHHRC